MERRRYSQQRELIRNYLMNTVMHPTAETIFTGLKEENPKLSRGTVYRNLGQMVESGEIIRLPFRVERYDAVVEPHAHFYCEECEEVTDLMYSLSDDDVKTIFDETGNLIIRQERIFYGICAKCRARMETN